MPTLSINNTTTTTTSLYETPSPGSVGIVGGLMTLYILVAICAIGSNTTILIAIVRRLVPRNTVNVFFSSLAVSDLLMTFLSSMDCFAYVSGSWPFGESVCKLQSLLLEVSFAASTLTLVAVSCERYLLICYPRIKKRTVRTIYFVLIGVWALSFVITSPLIHGYIVYEDINEDARTRKLVCASAGFPRRQALTFYSIYSFVTYAIPLMIMGFTHCRISQQVRDNDRRQSFRISEEKITISNVGNSKKRESVELGITDNDMSSDEYSDSTVKRNELPKKLMGPILHLKIRSNSVDREKKRNDRRIKAVRMLFVVTVVFFLLWSPFIIMRVAVLAGARISTFAYKLAEILIFSSTAVNGFIYAYMSPPFRRAFKAILCCRHKEDLLKRYVGNTLSNSEETSRRLNCSVSPNPSSISRIKQVA